MNYTLSRDPRSEDVAIYSNLRNYKNDTHFIAESEKIVSRLLRSRIEIASLYLTEEYLVPIRELIESHEQEHECTVFIGSPGAMAEIAGFKLHQSIMASARIPRERSLEDIIRGSRPPLLFVILDEIADAENMGAIFRTSLAMNATAIIIDKRSVSPWMRRAVRVSMGAVFDLPVVTVESIPNTIGKLKEKGVAAFATTLNESAKPIWNCDLRNDCAFVFGSEGHGIKKDIISVCENEVTIPMRDKFHSLNVGTAHGIFLYEILRQRNNLQ